MIVNIHAAKTTLSKLIAAAEAGEEIIVARNGKPAVKLTPVEPPKPQPKRKKGSWLGSMQGQIWMAPDMDAVDAEIAREFGESEIFPFDDETS
jgi:prevent-host-death family protein